MESYSSIQKEMQFQCYMPSRLNASLCSVLPSQNTLLSRAAAETTLYHAVSVCMYELNQLNWEYSHELKIMDSQALFKT